jgi:hypothetical protein
MSKKLISRRDILRIAAYVTSVIATMAVSPSIAATGPFNPNHHDKTIREEKEKSKTNNGLHKGWFKDHDNNGLHKGWYKDHDFNNNSNNDNGNPVRAVPEPGSLLLLATGISAIIWTLRKKR